MPILWQLVAFLLLLASCEAQRPPEPSPSDPSGSAEWSQHAHDPQRTGFTPQVVEHPWRWRWAWNGPNTSGGVSKTTSSGTLPRNVQPVTGGGRVYIAAGDDGVFALSEVTGQILWQRRGLGDVRSTVAYDPDTQGVFVVSSNGVLYWLEAATGAVREQFATDQRSELPLPPALLGDRVLFSMGSSIYAVDKRTLRPLWRYEAGSTVATPPAYSATRDLVLVATEPDLYVHAIENRSGARKWRVRPVPSRRRFEDPTEYRYGWPVVADGAGYVLVKVRLPWEALWRDWPQTNGGMRQMLAQYPGDQALFALDLDDGQVPFVANVGHGGYGDNDYLPMGTQPVVKRLANGQEVVYLMIRAKHGSYDARWDSHFGEMVLDSSTVSGLQAGDVRFIAFDWPPGSPNPYLITDEQPNVTMAGDYLFGAHWEAGFALRLLDRSDGRGSFANKIPTQRLSTIATSQEDPACAFNAATHYCPSRLYTTRPYDFGFYIYYRQGAVYDRYWSEYATWVVSGENLYFRSVDGAVVALTSGSPASSRIAAADPPPPEPLKVPSGPVAQIDHTAARAWAGQRVRVTGVLRYVFNNGKQVLLGFSNPHRGSLKALIAREHWASFPRAPEALYRPGHRVAITGAVGWYQGDPAIRVTAPEQIEVVGR